MCDLTCGNGGTPDLSECIACDCPTGYTGTLCEEDFDECSNSDTCSYGDCTNTIGSYTCSCFSGYTGQNCDSNIDECVEGTHECVNGARCVDAVPGYQCQCVDGTGGSRCEECTLPGCESCSIRERDGTVLCSKCLQGYYLTVQGQCGRQCVCYVNVCVFCGCVWVLCAYFDSLFLSQRGLVKLLTALPV